MQAAIEVQRWQKLEDPRFPGGWLCHVPIFAEVNRLQASAEDVQWLQGIAAGDREAFSSLYDRYATVLHSLALRILHEPEEAAEVLQDVFVQVWEKAHSYNPDAGKPFSWLLALTRNRAIDRLRARKRHYRFVEEVRQ